MCTICNFEKRYFQQVDIMGARSGGPCPGKPCGCSDSTTRMFWEIQKPNCGVCDGKGRIYSQVDITGAMTGGPCPGRRCPQCAGLGSTV
ncbi:MAG: hypothetical protein V7739_01240 [Motiliproteus sp.]